MLGGGATGGLADEDGVLAVIEDARKSACHHAGECCSKQGTKGDGAKIAGAFGGDGGHATHKDAKGRDVGEAAKCVYRDDCGAWIVESALLEHFGEFEIAGKFGEKGARREQMGHRPSILGGDTHQEHQWIKGVACETLEALVGRTKALTRPSDEAVGECNKAHKRDQGRANTHREFRPFHRAFDQRFDAVFIMRLFTFDFLTEGLGCFGFGQEQL